MIEKAENIDLIKLLDSLSEGVIMINERGAVVFINERIINLTGYEKDEIVGKYLSLIIPEQFSAVHQQHINKYFQSPKKRSMGTGFNLLARCKDGSVFPVEVSLSHLDTGMGKLGIAFLTDITLRKRAEDDLKIRNKELDKYAHTVAHNINSLLSGIIGLSEILVDTWGENPKEMELTFLKSIADNGRKLNDVVKEILLFASMKKEDVEKSNVNMKSVIKRACDRFKYQIEESSVLITTDENIFDCIGYGKWIEEVLYNFISNAIKYGGKPPVIEITNEKLDNGFIKYNVTDNGEGVPDELKPIIFDENNSEKKKLTKGYGLGLSIVKRIIEKLDGEVSVESEFGKGSTFSFILQGN